MSNTQDGEKSTPFLSARVDHLFSSAKYFNEGLKNLATLFLTGFALLFIVTITISMLWSDPHLSSFEVPKTMADRGYTSSVVKMRIQSYANEIVRQSKQNLEVRGARHSFETERVALDYNLGSGLTLRQVGEAALSFFGWSGNEIRGAITTSGGAYHVFLVRSGVPVVTSMPRFADEQDPEPVLRAIATDILADVHAYTVGTYHHSCGRNDAALVIAQRMKDAGTDLAWASNLECMTYKSMMQYSRAVTACKSVIQRNPNIFAAYANLGDALLMQGLVKRGKVYDTTPALRHFVEEARSVYLSGKRLLHPGDKSGIYCNLSAIGELLGEGPSPQLESLCLNDREQPDLSGCGG